MQQTTALAMKYAEHCETNLEFTAQAVKEAVALGTALVVAAGSWKRGGH